MIASAVVVGLGLGLDIADPIIGLLITAVILRITWDSWKTVRAGHEHIEHEHPHDGGSPRPPRRRL